MKASGGIRTLDDALAMISAGANRLGSSSIAEILGELGRGRGEVKPKGRPRPPLLIHPPKSAS